MLGSDAADPRGRRLLLAEQTCYIFNNPPIPHPQQTGGHIFKLKDMKKNHCLKNADEWERGVAEGEGLVET